MLPPSNIYYSTNCCHYSLRHGKAHFIIGLATFFLTWAMCGLFLGMPASPFYGLHFIAAGPLLFATGGLNMAGSYWKKKRLNTAAFVTGIIACCFLVQFALTSAVVTIASRCIYHKYLGSRDCTPYLSYFIADLVMAFILFSLTLANTILSCHEYCTCCRSRQEDRALNTVAFRAC